MPEDIVTGLIESAMADSGLNDSFADDGSQVETSVEQPVVEKKEETVVEDKPADKVEETVVEGGKKEDKPVETKADEVDKLLEAEGFKGGRDNRIPYSRTKKIIENTLKKRQEEFTTQTAERDTKIKSYETRLEAYNNADKLIREDPDRFLQTLAVMHPGKYDKFLANAKGAVEPKVGTEKPNSGTAKPGPDLKFDDGTVGYSPEQHDKLLGWVAEEATRKAVDATKAEYDKRFGPIEKTYERSVADNQRLGTIRNTMAAAYETYGEKFVKDNEPEILAALKENDRKAAAGLERVVPLGDMIHRVLIPKLRADKNKVREEVMEEANKRAKASEKTEARSTKKVTEPNPDAEVEDIIMAAMDAAGLK